MEPHSKIIFFHLLSCLFKYRHHPDEPREDRGSQEDFPEVFRDP